MQRTNVSVRLGPRWDIQIAPPLPSKLKDHGDVEWEECESCRLRGTGGKPCLLNITRPVRSWSYGSWGCLHKIRIRSSQPTLRQSRKGTSGVWVNVHCWQGCSHYKDPKGRMGAAEPSLSKAQRDSKAFLWSECGLRSYIQKVPTWSSPNPMLMAWRLLCYRDRCFQD